MTIKKIYHVPMMVYASMFERLLKTARKHGYCLLPHGSMQRDFDLIAVPWVEKCSSPEILAKALCKKMWWGGGVLQEEPEKKPHRRLGYTIVVGREWYIDLSIIPPYFEGGVVDKKTLKSLQIK